MPLLTVVFYVDTDKAMETFVEEVDAPLPDALKAAVAQARESGQSSSGHGVRDGEWSSATEIAILRGHGLDAYAGTTPRESAAVEAEIVRLAALHGLGTVDGRDRFANPNWPDQAEWRERILQCIPEAAEAKCSALAADVMAVMRGERPLLGSSLAEPAAA